MTKHGEVTWTRYDIPSRAGALLLAEHADDATAEQVLMSAEQLENCQLLDEGGEGRVYLAPNNEERALKAYFPQGENDEFGGVLGTVRANVAMHYGLDRVFQPNPIWRLRSPKMYGAFLSNNALVDYPYSYEPAEAVFAMERIKPVATPSEAKKSLLVYGARQRWWLYGKVEERFSSVSIAPDDDLYEPRNLLIERLPSLRHRGVAVAIDCYAYK